MFYFNKYFYKEKNVISHGSMKQMILMNFSITKLFYLQKYSIFAHALLQHVEETFLTHMILQFSPDGQRKGEG